jgi:hypothetical protein
MKPSDDNMTNDYNEPTRFQLVWHVLTTVTVGALLSSFFLGKPDVAQAAADDKDSYTTSSSSNQSSTILVIGTPGTTTDLGSFISTMPLEHPAYTGVILQGRIVFPADSSSLFSTDRFPGLRSIKLGESASIDTTTVRDMSRMLSGQRELTDVSFLTSADTSHVTSMAGLFADTGITDLSPLVDWDTSSVRNVTRMFINVPAHDYQAVSSWDVSRVQWFVSMFEGSGITDVSPLSSWNVSNGLLFTDMFRSTDVMHVSPLSSWNISDHAGTAMMFYGTLAAHHDYVINELSS